ncbi:hypothetical protein NDI52_33835 [Leptolyngbya sp. PL-A3]|uniref:hypothetical protein n=1 Tax=Leptolyngbya sp. PL-A3 TaxID=2933911 RepID=UPI003298AEC9
MKSLKDVEKAIAAVESGRSLFQFCLPLHLSTRLGTGYGCINYWLVKGRAFDYEFQWLRLFC